MSHADKKQKKLFSIRESVKDKWRLIHALFDEKKHEFVDKEVILENKEVMVKTLNDFGDRIDADIKKKKSIDSNEAKAYLILFYGILLYFPQTNPLTLDTNFSRFERFLAPKVPNSIKLFAFEIMMMCVLNSSCDVYLKKILEYIDLNPFSTKILDLPSMNPSEFPYSEEIDEKTNQPVRQMKNIDCSVAKLVLFFQIFLKEMKSFEMLLPTFIQIIIVMFPNSSPDMSAKLKVFPQVPSKLLFIICEYGICKMNAEQRLRIMQSCPFFPLVLKQILEETFALVLEEPQLLYVIRWFFSFLTDPLTSVTLNKLTGKTKEQFDLLLNSIIKTTESFYILTPLVTSYPEVSLSFNGELVKKDVVQFLNDFLNVYIVPSQTSQIKEQLKTSLHNSLKLFYQRAFEAKKLQYGYVHKRIACVTQTLLKTWIAWPPNDSAWEELQTTFIPLMAVDGVIRIFETSFSHLTMCLLSVQFSTKPKEQLFTRTCDDPQEPITFDNELKMVTSSLFKEDLMRIWKYLWKFIDISVDIPNEERAERWHQIMYSNLQMILLHENRIGASKFELHDVFVPFLLSTASKNHFKLNNKALCQILCRRFPQYSENVISVLIGYVRNVIQQSDVSILSDIYDLFTTTIKGKTSVLNEILISLRCLNNEQANGLNVNQQIKIVTLLNSLLFYSNIYPSINTLLSDDMGYQDILALCYSNLNKVFTSPEPQQSILWGIVINFLIACEAKRPNDELRLLSDFLLQKVVTSNPTVSKQAIRSLRIIARSSYIIPTDILNYIAESVLIFISNSTVDENLLPMVLEQLQDLLFAPNGVLSQSVSAALQSVLGRLSDNPNLYVQQFIMMVEHFYNRKINVPCCDDSFTRDIFFIGTNRVTSENDQTIYFMQNNSIYAFTNNGNGVDIVVRNLYGTYHWVMSDYQKKIDIVVKDFNFKPEKPGNEPTKCLCDQSFSNLCEGMNDLGESIDNEMKEELTKIEMSALSLNAEILKLSKKPIEVENEIIEIENKWSYIGSLELLTNNKEPIVQLNNNKTLKQLLFKLDCLPIRKRYNCSLVYLNAESKLSKFNNSSKQFNEFAGSLGYLITKDSFNGYFPKDFEKVYYYSDETVEMTFSPSTYFNGSSIDTSIQPCVIVWNENELELDTSIFSNAQTIIEIRPRSDGMFVIDMWRNAVSLISIIDLVGPLQTSMIVPKNFLPILVRETAINITYFNSSALSQLQLRQYVFSEIGTKTELILKAFSSIATLELSL